MMIYLDNNGTTKVSDEVFEAMLPFLQNHYGNPSSSHKWGRENRKAIEKAREKVAQLFQCDADEIYFTSCATEANNTVIKGILGNQKGKHIITSSIEHPSILLSCKYMEKQGYEVTYLPVDKKGLVSIEDFKNSIRDDTVLVSIMHANNQVGTIQPIKGLSEIAKEKKILFHSDAAQSIGKEKILIKDLGVDMLTIAGHKFHAPKGIGAFYLRKDTMLEPFLHGGSHEKGKRAGTENLAFCVALGKACEVVMRDRESYYDRLVEMRDLLLHNIQKKIPNAVLNGDPVNRLPNTVNIAFPGMIGADILAETPDIAAATGSSCSKSPTSYVLKAMGIEEHVFRGSIRFSLSKYNTLEEITIASEKIIATVLKLSKR